MVQLYGEDTIFLVVGTMLRWAESFSEVFQKLLDENISLQDYGVISDTAFPVTGPLQGRIVTPLKDNDLDRIAPDLSDIFKTYLQF